MWREAVIARDQRCMRCGSIEWLEAAHIIRRGYSRTRCDLSNGRALCHACHVAQTENRWWWDRLIGAEEYHRLYKLATDASWKRPSDWWETQAQQLRSAA